MSTRYTAFVTKHYELPNGTPTTDYVMNLYEVHPWELAPALKLLAKKIHESPPPVVLEGQEAML